MIEYFKDDSSAIKYHTYIMISLTFKNVKVALIEYFLYLYREDISRGIILYDLYTTSYVLVYYRY